SVPAEASLSVENKVKLPSAVLNFGNDLPVGKVTPASYREAILAASEESFSKREFFNGSLTIALIDGLKKHGQSTTLFDGLDRWLRAADGADGAFPSQIWKSDRAGLHW
ncbi:hypothetical protein N8617_02395, partial [Akkermansiaceae bacterium]|nr:hypothetical protein [Akkermansiaceae bacterium]